MQKKKNLMQFLIFFCYELSVCPLIFKSDKVYFESSLIAKPNVYMKSGVPWNYLKFYSPTGTHDKILVYDFWVL